MCGWEDNDRIDLRGIWCECVDWIQFNHEQVQQQTSANTEKKFLVPQIHKMS